MIGVNESLLIRDNEFWLWSVYIDNQFYILAVTISLDGDMRSKQFKKAVTAW